MAITALCTQGVTLTSTRHVSARRTQRPAAWTAAGKKVASRHCAAPSFERLAIQDRHGVHRGQSIVTKAIVKEFTSFDDMIATSEVPVLVDFYAVWCGPCQMLSPILADIQNTLKNSLKVVKINTEKYPEIATRFQITALPTLILFKKGVPVDRIEGMMTRPDLIVRLRYFLNQP